MAFHLTIRKSGAQVPLVALDDESLKAWLETQGPSIRSWCGAMGFAAKPGEVLALPGDDGALAGVAVGIAGDDPIWSFAALPSGLPPVAPARPKASGGAPAGTHGVYVLDNRVVGLAADWAALGWGLGTYGFTRYRADERRFATLLWPAEADRHSVERQIGAHFLVRDLINTPAADMGPAELEAAARTLARTHGAKVTVIKGGELLRRNYPAIHAVGQGSPREPRLIDLTWGEGRKRVTVVGKGVCFDSGGLDLKSSDNMLLMKKDMGGAAHALGLASAIMAAKLPLRLRVLIPAVENSISGRAYRPLDVIKTRKGLSVEIGNTDAEGRLVLADALAEAVRERPQLLVDFATLTGAARVALGTEVPALFCRDAELADAVMEDGRAAHDPLWRLPLHQPYRRQLDSPVADLNNVGKGRFGGAITAALFLAEFVPPAIPWIHIDLMAWNLTGRPGRPEGGEAQGLRALTAAVARIAGR